MINKSKKLLFFTTFSTFLLIFGCSKTEKHISKPVFNIETAQFYQEIEGLKVTSRKLNQNNATLLTSKKILSKYQPIELRIENNTPSTFSISDKNLSIPLAPIKNIIKRTRTGLLGSLFFPIASITTEKYCSNILISAIATPFALFGPGVQIANFSLPIVYFWSIPASAMISVALTGRDNRKKAKIVKNNSSDFTEELIIKPHTIFQTIIFTEHQNYKPNIELTIQNKEIKSYLTFKINLEEMNSYVIYEK